MKYVAAILYAVAASVLVALMLCVHGLDKRIAWVALAAGALVGACSLWTERRRALGRPGITAWEWAAIVAFALFSLRAFLWVVFPMGDEVRVLVKNNLGDLPLHVTYVRYLANGVPFWPDNPILSGTKLTYPLGVDLYHSLLLLAGVPLRQGFIWMGLIGAALTGVALWKWGRGFAIAGFLANGGLAGFEFFRTWTLEDFQGPHAWKSIPLALFVTQRGLLFALPAGLALLGSWRARYFRGEGEPLPRWGELLLYASMPVFHLHTFLALSLVLGWWFAMHVTQRWRILGFVAAALAPATLLTLCVTGRLHGPAMLGWHAGWMQDDADFMEWCRQHLGTVNPLLRVPVFWIWNFGVLPVLLAMLAWRTARGDSDRWSRAIVWPAISIFVLCCFVKFAIWEWDNTKLMIWAYLLVLPLLWRDVLARMPAWERWAAVFLLFCSGFLSLAGGLGKEIPAEIRDLAARVGVTAGMGRDEAIARLVAGGLDEKEAERALGLGYAIATRSEVGTLEPALRGMPPTTRFLAYPTYNHPLLLLGHPVALGYTGHVWSHGYSYKEPLAQVESVFRGEPGWRETARQLDCRYLFWGREEQAAYPDSPQPWREQAHLSASGEWGELYDLETPPAAPQTPPPR